MTCVSVHGMLSKLGDTLRAFSTAVVCLLLDCCRVAASGGGLPEGVVPEPPQGCVRSCGELVHVGWADIEVGVGARGAVGRVGERSAPMHLLAVFECVRLEAP
jgi:hypothetical protein